MHSNFRIKQLKIVFLLLFIPFIALYPGTPKPYKTISKSVVNGYLQTITTYYTPTVRYKQVAVMKNFYKDGIVYKRDVAYEKRPVVTWKKRSEYKYEPLIK
ncbi:MAG: hypothetical protein Q8933_08565 [Bacteroidota bacterium]|nr:hypothetical protein [Bacteroidota bacterium]MDP4190302.1 hypothetical protein [Bacteroidota bacterium]MDP4196606.1 hypothetical protein [Bacteroidota bacterium]